MGKPLLTDEIIERANRGSALIVVMMGRLTTKTRGI